MATPKRDSKADETRAFTNHRLWQTATAQMHASDLTRAITAVPQQHLSLPVVHGATERDGNLVGWDANRSRLKSRPAEWGGDRLG